ncbi:MAG: YihY family inner membrane protein, partial [Victivallales bacterium]|nr:YihY family inner membrane protein [Victivallales bacterium]
AFCKGIGLQHKLMETIGLKRIVKIVKDDHGANRKESTYQIIPSDPPEETAAKPDGAAEQAVTEGAENTAAPLPSIPSTAVDGQATAKAEVVAVIDPAKAGEEVVLVAGSDAAGEGMVLVAGPDAAGEGVMLVVDQATAEAGELPPPNVQNPAEEEGMAPEPGLQETPSAEKDSQEKAIPTPRRISYAAELPEAMQTALIALFTYVEKTNFAALGLVGVAALLFSVLSAIHKLEENLNAIWCVKKGRNLLQQFSQYLVVLLLFPIVSLLAISLATYMHSGELAAKLHTSSPVIIMLGQLLGNLLMYLFLWGGFTFLYLFMPHTRVRVIPAMLGGFFGSLIWLAVLYVYIRWQVGLANFNAIYGGFAALPFFLAWLYTSWVVVLLGAEISYAAQNIRLTRLTKHLPSPDPATNHLLGIAAMQSICRSFDAGKGPWNAIHYAATHAIALNELTAALDILVRANLIIQLPSNDDPSTQRDYIPVRPPAQITLAEVHEAFLGMEEGRAQEISLLLPDRLITSLQNYHRENLRLLKEINFEK